MMLPASALEHPVELNAIGAPSVVDDPLVLDPVFSEITTPFA
jgi:hypothetical protein